MRPPSSRQRYFDFVELYRRRALGPSAPGAGRRARRAPAWPYLREYATWLSPHWRALISVVVLAVAATSVQMLEPLVMRYIVDHVLLPDHLARASRLSLLRLASTVFALVIVTGTVLLVTKNYRQRLLSARLTTTIRRRLCERLLRLPLARLSEMKVGGILSRLTGDVDMTSDLIAAMVISPATALLRVAITTSILFFLNWRLAVTALAIVPAAVVISAISTGRVRPIYRSLRADAEQVDGRVGEVFSGIRIVRTFQTEAKELGYYVRGRHTFLRKELFAYRRELAVFASWSFLVGALNVVIFGYGGALQVAGVATVGDIMAFQCYAFLLLNPISQLVTSVSDVQRSVAAMERVFDVATSRDEMPDRPDARDAPRVVEEIRFENVDFEYRPGISVVRDLTLTVPAGSVVALVGRSGAGKTTVTNLVARFQEPTRGRILLNGADVRWLRIATYRRLLAIVQQEVFLFDGSVRENIGYGRHDATDAEIKSAARLAHADEFIAQLPDGYDTVVGERGVKLSGGQQQRVAIARAIIAAPQILILDEATSNLDSESEQLIQRSMASLLVGRTTFVIAHRLATVRRANLILLMDNGRVIERGTHDALMRARGRYYDMVCRQMFWDNGAVESALASQS